VTEQQHRRELASTHAWEQVGMGRVQETREPGRWHAFAHLTGFGRAAGWVPHTHGQQFETALAADATCDTERLDALARLMRPARPTPPRSAAPVGQLDPAGSEPDPSPTDAARLSA
jgi:hypothetical protein